VTLGIDRVILPKYRWSRDSASERVEHSGLERFPTVVDRAQLCANDFWSPVPFVGRDPVIWYLTA